MVVHFPIALLTVYALMELVWSKRLRKNESWLYVKAAFLIIGLLGAYAALSTGEMAAVWLKAEREVTLKAVYFETDFIRLQPANNEMEAILMDPGNVEIQGRVVAVIRQLG